MDIASKALTHLGASKTYTLLLLISVIAIVVCLLAAAFGEQLWAKLLDVLMVNSGVGGARAAVNDGLPKIASAWRDPNSLGANPPSAMQPPAHQPPPVPLSMPTATPRYPTA